MKRIIAMLLVAFSLSFAMPLYAATTGSCALTEGYIDNANLIYRITWVCTSDASAGTVPSTYSSASITGWVYNVDLTVSGSVPPTSSGAVTLIDSASGNDVMGGNCTVGTTTSRCVPAKSGWVNGTLTPGFGTDNFGNSKVFTIRAYIWRQKTK